MSSLENRGNGSWRLTISDGYAPDGKKIRFQQAIRDAMHTRQAVSGDDFTFTR